METPFEKVILIGIQSSASDNTEASLLELAELARTAGTQCVGSVIQVREFVHPATYIGAGKIEEVRALIATTEANCIICDDELSPTQMRNLEKELDIKVCDRTVLILDIFATRASTAEGKIQVELAQLKYSLTRLQGYGTSMSRLGGGIGTRGPGESKLESDRRVIRKRVSVLNHELKEVVKHREVTRAGRDRNRIPVVAIVGYTNAGKSTLLNTLTNAGVLSEDKLFATLDPTTRMFKLPSGAGILLTDTVGFINKLPHHLVEAFKSTLEEAKYSDLILHVVDASNPDHDKQIELVYETLHNLEIEDKPIVTLFNKMDVADPSMTYKDARANTTINVSAKTGLGLSKLSEVLESFLRSGKVHFEGLVSFEKGALINLVHTQGEVISEEYTEAGIKLDAYVPESLYGKLNKK